MLALTDYELHAAVNGGQRWAAERDFPDPVAWADLAFAANATVALIRARNDGRWSPAKAHQLPLPKGVGAELRPMTVPDPFDEIVFRALVGRAALTIDNALGREVTSYRLAEGGPAWEVRDYRYSAGQRTGELFKRVNSPEFRGLGTLDIRNYYPSIDVPKLADLLLQVGVESDAALAIFAYLEAWQLWGVRGVPIGPEASGLLGNIFLLPVDRALSAAGFDFGRYTDDYRIWLDGPHSWPAARDLVCGAIEPLGLQLNPSKTRHLRTTHGVLMQLTNGDIDTLKKLLDADVALGLSAAMDLFDAEVAKSFPDSKRMKFLLRVFKNRICDYALAAVQGRPELLQADPRTWADYLAMMHGRKLLDLDWLLGIVKAAPTPVTAAVAYHLMRVVAVRPVGREHGRVLGEFAADNDRQWMPVRCAAAEAWMRSDAWNPGNATEAALSVGDPQQRRALVLTLRSTDSGRKVATALAKLHAAVPECRPTVAWMRAGGHLAAA